MCGISGFTDFNKGTDRAALEKMNRMLGHRGPDGEGYALYDHPNATIGLGHRRLSIIDLTEGGRQPKTFDTLHITFNGEIYNYLEIKKQLLEKGHQFNSHSDSEVILHAYAEWGMTALQQFIGMFTFGLLEELTGSMRNSILAIMAFFIVGLLLLLTTIAAKKRSIS